MAGPVFNRRLAFHRFDAALRELENGGTEEQALASNLRYDHRISAKRARWFDKLTCRPRSGHALRLALDNYLDYVARSSPDLTFLDPEQNAENILGRIGEVEGAADPGTALLRALDITRLAQKVFPWAKQEFDRLRELDLFEESEETHRALAEFASFPDNDTDAATWLDQRLGRGADPSVLVGAALLVINHRARHVPFHPTWTVFRAEFDEHANSDVHRWLELLGLTKYVGSWVVLLSYTIDEAGTLVRPTHLDAGSNGRHFPSPPGLDPAVGGLAMDLARPGRTMLREFVHETIDHDLDHWKEAGLRIGQTIRAPARRIERVRRLHREGLSKRFSTLDLTDWMP